MSTQFAPEEYRSDLIDVTGLLREGVNTLAFELHQSSLETTDRGFDLALSVSNPNARGVLADAVDVENHELNATVSEGPTHGAVVLEPNGAFTYTPDVDFFGEDRFVFVASDGEPGGESAQRRRAGSLDEEIPHVRFALGKQRAAAFQQRPHHGKMRDAARSVAGE